MTRSLSLRLWAAGIAAVLAAPAVAAEQSETAAFFEKKVKPVLEKHCFQCHSHAAKKFKGKLALDSLDAALKGGNTGPALVAGKPADSLMIKAVGYSDPDVKMPPKGKMPDEDIEILTRWVRDGAVWPGAAAKTTARPRGVITDEDRKWWAFQPVREPAIPEVAGPDAPSHPIDRFIRARLAAEGLKPSPPADPVALIRRVTFDLIGLPPTPAEIDLFVEAFRAQPQAAYEALVDRLLASPRYGEHWARHWLDLVRYAESDGFRIDDYRPYAWRYRDWVIKSFNDDKPYDRFVREQLAGDELAPDDPDALAGTAFLRLGIYEYNNRDVRTQWDSMLNDVTDVVGDVFLGMGMGCARCHDHKFDPILQKDYYRLQAYFAATLPHDDSPLATAQQRADYDRRLKAWQAKAAAVLAKIEAIEGPARAKAENSAIEKFPDEIQVMMRKPESKRSPLEQQLASLAYRQVLYEFARLDSKLKDEEKKQVIALRKELAAFEADKPAPLPAAYTVRDVGAAAPPTFIPKKAGAPPVEPGPLTVLDEKPAAVVPPPGLASTGRRSDLANRLTAPDHPLTTRVVVNRIWQYHFGRGLAAVTSDFGRLGEKPSHPELLDWLAIRFARDGWSFKKMHRLILTSETYRQSALAPAPEAALLKDPENRLLWRMTTRRVDAEQIRDSLLAATGVLDLKAGGPAVEATVPRRSIYLRSLRNSRDPLLEVFDAPDGIASNPQRNVTTTPTQALLMINSGYMLKQAKAFADRLRKDAPSSDDGVIADAAFRLVYGRPATAEEKSAAAAFLDRAARRGISTVEAAATLQFGKIPFREGKAMLFAADGPPPRLQVADSPKLPDGDFTIEAFILLKALYDDAAPRPIASHWNGDKNSPGWSFGVTSKKSAYKPQTLVLQMWGQSGKGEHDYEPLFSGLHIELNKPYFVAVSVKLSETGKAGVTFYAKDLSNDDEPMQSAHLAHAITKMPRGRDMLTLGAGGPKSGRTWEGLLDDVRISRAALPAEQLLLTSEGVNDKTAAYWQFEPQPGVLKDASASGLDITLGTVATKGPPPDARMQALIDFCHVLLNSNEFLYVD